MKVLYDDERSKAAQECLIALYDVLRVRGFVLGHEDTQGAFTITKAYPSESHSWLLNAQEVVE